MCEHMFIYVLASEDRKRWDFTRWYLESCDLWPIAMLSEEGDCRVRADTLRH